MRWVTPLSLSLSIHTDWLAPIPGQFGLINATRKGKNIIIEYSPAEDISFPNDVLQYAPYVF
jgi:hypothetical protein